MYFIYLFTNKQNSKVYVGKTNNIARRNREHLSESNKTTENRHFYNAIKKYGFESFTHQVIFECENEDEAYEMEQYYIAFYQSNDKTKGYNSTIGGDGVRGINEEARKKLSERGKLRVGDKNTFYGQHHTEETKQIISQTNIGNTYWLGRKHTKEAKLSISKSKSGKRVSPNTEFKLGQLPANAKITMEQAKEIRIKSQNGAANKELQKEYNLGGLSIWRILTNRTYKE